MKGILYTFFVKKWNLGLPLYLNLKCLNYFSASPNGLSFNPDGSAVNPGAFQQHIQRDSNLMAQLFQVKGAHMLSAF